MTTIRSSGNGFSGGGVTTRPTSARERGAGAAQVRAGVSIMPPVERGYRYIPSLDELEALIGRALHALREGVYWDRGSIVNIVV